MTSSSHWLAIQYDDTGKVVDVAPFGGERTASRYALAAGRAKEGWTVRHVPEGKTAADVFGDDLPEVGPRKAPAKPSAPILPVKVPTTVPTTLPKPKPKAKTSKAVAK